MIKGTQVTLRPATLDDKRMIYDWAHRSDIAHQLHLPPDDHLCTWEEWCEDWQPHYFDDSAPELGRFFVIMVEGCPVGAVAHNCIDGELRTTELDIWMSCEANCGKGYGPDALGALCDHLSRTRAVSEFWLQPSARNPRAVRAYEKAGFKRRELTREEAEDLFGGVDSPDSVFLVKRLPVEGVVR